MDSIQDYKCEHCDAALASVGSLNEALQPKSAFDLNVATCCGPQRLQKLTACALGIDNATVIAGSGKKVRSRVSQ